MAIVNVTEPKAGDIVTGSVYTDSYAFDVLKSSEKSMTIRKRRTIRVTAPEMEVGGFCAVVVKASEFKSEPDENGVVFRVLRCKDGTFRSPYNKRSPMVIGDYPYHDDAF